MYSQHTHLDETDGSGLLAEALTAEVNPVLADETSLMRAKAAVHSTDRTKFVGQRFPHRHSDIYKVSM